jgi:hypothetical protein
LTIVDCRLTIGHLRFAIDELRFAIVDLQLALGAGESENLLIGGQPSLKGITDSR